MKISQQILSGSDTREIELLHDDIRLVSLMISDDGHISVRFLQELQRDYTIPVHFLLEAISNALAIAEDRFD